ncbi:hypothetical protein K432DRAFT_404152 [Lepidopterella palustris CBS 459.81]|uniref:F-box domain-containing protein n=1 Tax=Lepidopterella palustris CBS 459.81 TaxID=1314670 RepID=A0A8E2EC56_9PEZI|nr:hypothetical protein K432DRAFT_404152 [Lepidopterella palustris CBS 459.81]
MPPLLIRLLNHQPPLMLTSLSALHIRTVSDMVSFSRYGGLPFFICHPSLRTLSLQSLDQLRLWQPGPKFSTDPCLITFLTLDCYRNTLHLDTDFWTCLSSLRTFNMRCKDVRLRSGTPDIWVALSRHAHSLKELSVILTNYDALPLPSNTHLLRSFTRLKTLCVSYHQLVGDEPLVAILPPSLNYLKLCYESKYAKESHETCLQLRAAMEGLEKILPKVAVRRWTYQGHTLTVVRAEFDTGSLTSLQTWEEWLEWKKGDFWVKEPNGQWNV